jgi:metal-sulfur cluster biosynthetic enzyme
MRSVGNRCIGTSAPDALTPEAWTPASAGVTAEYVDADRRSDVDHALDTVLDPELDEPVTALGFVTRVAIKGDAVAVDFRLPTYWCSPNFAWIMAEDMRAALRALPWVRRVTVTLADHLFAEKINAAVNRGEGFGDAFGAAGADLAQLRAIFRRKAYLGRMATLIEALRDAGRSDAKIMGMTVGDLRRVIAPGGGQIDLPVLLGRYLALRAVFGGRDDEADPAFRTPEGEDIAPAALPLFLRGIRMTRRGAEANGEMCRIFLRERADETAAKVGTGGPD